MYWIILFYWWSKFSPVFNKRNLLIRRVKQSRNPVIPLLSPSKIRRKFEDYDLTLCKLGIYAGMKWGWRCCIGPKFPLMTPLGSVLSMRWLILDVDSHLLPLPCQPGLVSGWQVTVFAVEETVFKVTKNNLLAVWRGSQLKT